MATTTTTSIPAILAYTRLQESILGRAPLETVMRCYIMYIWACSGHNQTRAADVLRVSRRTVIRWMNGVNALDRG